MTSPIRKVCHGAADLPSLQMIKEWVTDDHHLVLTIEPSSDEPHFDERVVIDRLAPLLPEFTVFNSGGAVTIKKVVAEQEVLAVSDALVAAAAQFRLTATSLMHRLAQKLAIPVEAFYSLEYWPRLRRGWLRMRRGTGRLGFRWKYAFHGRQCRFKNWTTGQVLDVEMGFHEEFGVLDPFFFYQFINTTPGLETVALLFKDNFDDPARALEILERHGRLRRITDDVTGRTGLVVFEN